MRTQPIFLVLLLLVSLSGCRTQEIQTSPEPEVEQSVLSAPLADIEELESELDFSELDTLESDLQNLDW